MARRRSFWIVIAFVLAGVGLLVPGAGGAATNRDINPSENFDGQVNRQSDGAVVTLECEGTSPRSGRARPGNTVSVDDTGAEGFTGSNGTGVRARFFSSASGGSVVQNIYFDKYSTRSIAGYVFPANQPGRVEFVPWNFRTGRPASGGVTDVDSVTYACTSS